MVCFFDPDTYPGVYNSCNIMAEKGWVVDVVCLRSTEFQGTAFDDRIGIHRIDNRNGRPGGAARFARLAWSARKVCRSRRWDMAIGHDMHGLVAARLNGALPASRIAFWSQDMAEPSLLGLGQRTIMSLKRQFIRSCPLVIAPSRTRADALGRFFPLRTEPHIVYNSPRKDIAARDEQWRRRLGIPQTTPIVVYCGGFGQDRRVPELVESVAFWPKESALVMAGYGRAGTAERMVALAARTGVADRVHFVGQLPNIFGLVREAQVGVSFFPADTGDRNREFRGIASNKIFEYLALGKPAIVSANPETMEFMTRFECGGCVTDHTPRGIAGAVAALLADPVRLALTSRNARQTHERETHFEKRFSTVQQLLASLCNPPEI